jgi:hypothetical protein
MSKFTPKKFYEIDSRFDEKEPYLFHFQTRRYKTFFVVSNILEW